LLSLKTAHTEHAWVLKHCAWVLCILICCLCVNYTRTVLKSCLVYIRVFLHLISQLSCVPPPFLCTWFLLMQKYLLVGGYAGQGT
jgi:hypothetical protein